MSSFLTRLTESYSPTEELQCRQKGQACVSKFEFRYKTRTHSSDSAKLSREKAKKNIFSYKIVLRNTEFPENRVSAYCVTQTHCELFLEKKP